MKRIENDWNLFLERLDEGKNKKRKIILIALDGSKIVGGCEIRRYTKVSHEGYPE
ncbi:MAG: hypothetical protein SVE93_02625 [Candidatus Thermoplasmatota archaeon]|nr:hypothetical protein [Candidatus Thermoplasmatota archaeon]